MEIGQGIERAMEVVDYMEAGSLVVRMAGVVEAVAAGVEPGKYQRLAKRYGCHWHGVVAGPRNLATAVQVDQGRKGEQSCQRGFQLLLIVSVGGPSPIISVQHYSPDDILSYDKDPKK